MHILLRDTYTDLYFIDSDSKTKEEVLRKISQYAQHHLSINAKSLYDALIKLNRHETHNRVIIMAACLSKSSRPFAFILCKMLNPINFRFPDSESIQCILLHLNRDQTNLDQLKPMANLTAIIKNDEYRKKLLKATSDNDIVTLFRLFDIYKDKMKEKK